MLGNGVRIGMMKITIVVHQSTTHPDRTLVHKDGESCAGAIGIIMASTYVWLTATPIPIIGATTAGFVAY